MNSKTSAATLKPADAATQAKVNEAYGKLPLSFEINRGQADPSVKFLSRGANYSFSLAATEATLRLRGASANQPATVRMKLVNANPSPWIEGVDQLPGKSNYLIGETRSKWRTGIANYAKVRYREIYRGIDLIFYGNQRQLEYDFVVEPGADPNVIELSFDGAERLRIDQNGDLVLGTPGGEVRQSKPVIYQEVNGQRRGVNGRYTIHNQTVGFKVATYDRSRRLVIDPVMVYSTFLGGKGRETARGIAVDTAGNVYVTGETFSTDFPVSGRLQNGDPGQPSLSSTHAFVSKLNATGTALVYSTYLGGAGQDTMSDIAVDASGNVYVAGTTQSSDFPLVNAAQVFPGNNFFTSADSGANWRTGGTLAGIVALAIDPSNSATVYAGTASGLYKSANGGGAWTRSGSGLPDQRAVTALLVDPKNPSALHAATSSAVYLDQGAVNRGTDGMVFKSTDGGGSWNRIGAALTIERVNAFALDPTNSAIIYVAASNGGVFKSTDGGANWNAINNGFAAGGNPPTLFNATSIAIDSSNPSRIFALVNGGLYRSVNGGATWALNLMGTAPRALAMDPRNPSTIYAGTGGASERGLFKTTDGGETWKAIGTGLTVDNKPDFNLSVTALAIDPINPSILYAGVEEIGDRFYKVYKSMDGGESWSPSRKGLADANVQLLAVDPQAPSRLHAGFRVKTDNVAFAAKINPSGSALVYSTYVCYGESKGIVVDASGAVYLAGMASFGSLAATPGAVQEADGGGRPASNAFVPPGATQPIYDLGHADAFVAKLNAAGSAFVYATYLGGKDNDKAAGLALDAAGNAYVTGSTDSPDFPVTPNALQTDGATILGRKAWVA
ncbi:MAG: SBBP repeat-containing protein, partial [Blastocatellia bacterium]